MIIDKDLPGLYRAADKASLNAQTTYYLCLMSYLLLLVLAASVSFWFSDSVIWAMISTGLFLLTLGILVFLRIIRPDDTWYNGRAVAESVKTRSWRWMMRAEPYDDCENLTAIAKEFIKDQKDILKQNESLAGKLPTEEYMKEPITEAMKAVRAMTVAERLNVYRSDRIQNQADWYSVKAAFNKKRSLQWFCVAIGLHGMAILMLLCKINKPLLSLPVTVIATTASAVLTWFQTKKHNELGSSYSLAAHEINLIKGEALSINSENELSAFVVNTESAFSREHTQWVSQKNR